MTRSSIDLAVARCMPAGLLSDFYGRQPAATLITKDEARPIAANLAKLSALVEVSNHRDGWPLCPHGSRASREDPKPGIAGPRSRPISAGVLSVQLFPSVREL